MTGRVVLMDRLGEREVAALLVDGRIEEIAIDSETSELVPGAICRVVANRPVKGQGGIFVRLPGGESGFLRQISGIAPGQRLIVQVSGPAEEGKAVPVTTRLLFKSRYVIFTPGAPGVNISRQIRDEETREALEALAGEGMAGADPTLGLILRSSCSEAESGDIADDLRNMRDLAEAVLADLNGEPELLLDAPGAHDLAWRDWVDPAPEEVRDEAGCFDDEGVSDQLDELLLPRVGLPGGGHMQIEPTRALIAIDINTGPDTSPAAALKVNIAAARELPRQLRLRGLGGQIVIDFAPMPKRDRNILEQVIRAAFKSGGESTLSGWTGLGLYELTRRRDRLALSRLWT
ncbi:ribonuclease E/G [Pseudogemmobacter faecipullorum]|uniref:Ribonuclease E/G n=1 Tax=Pseudogemmobacter faecipullorum TaxID=2755041 RepID=A0ABS8CMB7_9RHOB|nr:ribonuclease E/G [Pseudogemmobacter faecipullorum]MCB5410538.1 ribonuclease E/G [Pseudogemmobacter faecipullorum]